jgi:hypothetical protein
MWDRGISIRELLTKAWPVQGAGADEDARLSALDQVARERDTLNGYESLVNRGWLELA